MGPSRVELTDREMNKVRRSTAPREKVDIYIYGLAVVHIQTRVYYTTVSLDATEAGLPRPECGETMHCLQEL